MERWTSQEDLFDATPVENDIGGYCMGKYIVHNLCSKVL